MHPVPDSKCAYRGFSLVEILVFIAVFSMAIVMLSKLFVTTSLLSAYGMQIVDRMNEVREVQRDFSEVARSAVAVVSGIGKHHTDGDTLVLQLHQDGEQERYVVLGMFGGERHLCMMEVTGNDTDLHADKYVTWRLPVASVRFEVDDTGRRVMLELVTQSQNRQKSEGGRTHRFIVALRTNTIKERGYK